MTNKKEVLKKIKNEQNEDNKQNRQSSTDSDRCLIISGGRFINLPKEKLGASYVIACDKGLEYADKYGILPDVITGDFDSVSGDVLEGMADRSALILRYPKEKDDTDTLIAVKHALSKGYRELVIICAMGNRTDHAFANLQTAHYAAKEGALVRIYDDEEEIIVFCDSTVTINQRENAYLSVFSLDERSEGVDIKGTKYELEDAVLTNTFPVGVSNEFSEEQAAISVRKGSLLVIIRTS